MMCCNTSILMFCRSSGPPLRLNDVSNSNSITFSDTSQLLSLVYVTRNVITLSSRLLLALPFYSFSTSRWSVYSQIFEERAVEPTEYGSFIGVQMSKIISLSIHRTAIVHYTLNSQLCIHSQHSLRQANHRNSSAQFYLSARNEKPLVVTRSY